MTTKKPWRRALAITTSIIGVATITAGVAGFAAYRMGLGPFAPPQADMAIDAATRAATIQGAIDQIEQHYVFPDQAAALGKHLREQAKRGDFDSITSAETLARTLSDSLRKDSGDGHLSVRYFEEAIAELPPGEEQTPAEKAEEAYNQKRLNYGFATVSRLSLNIGYIDIHAFGRPQQAQAKIAAAMTLMKDTHALIIDLRDCRGGDPETVMLLANYFFDRPTHLNDIYWRDESRTESRWTQPVAEGLGYGTARKVYILIGKETFSAGEDFAYALKSSGRATIVGAPTEGGGAHPCAPRRINSHFMIFVPTGRAINAVTHTNWQKTGVQPDLLVAEKKALDAAQVEIAKEVMASDPDPRIKRTAKQQISKLN